MTATASHIPLKLPPRTPIEVFEMLPEGTIAEVVNNNIYISPVPNIPHQRVSIRLASLLWFFIEEEKKLGVCFSAPSDVYLDDKNIVQPDVLFISTVNLDIIKDGKIKGVPDLIIEILSTNRSYDLQDKKNLYEKFGVKEYFIVDPATKETFAYYHNGRQYIKQENKVGKIRSKLLKKVFTF